MSQSEDLDAINRYISNSQPATSKAVELRDDWIRWFNDLSWYSKSLSQDTYDEARNRRNEFSIANATNSAEKAKAKEVAKKGFTTEQAQGEASRILSDGSFPHTPEPLIPTWAKVVAGATLVAAILVTASKVPDAIATTIAFRPRRSRIRDMAEGSGNL